MGFYFMIEHIYFYYSVIHDFVATHLLFTLLGIVVLGLFWWKRRESFYKVIIPVIALMLAYYIFTLYSGALEDGTGERKDLIRAPKIEKSN